MITGTKMQHLLELGAEIEQESLLTPFHTEIALISLENIRNIILDSNQNQNISETTQDIPIADPVEILTSDDETVFDADYSTLFVQSISDNLGPIQRAQVNSIPCLHHN